MVAALALLICRQAPASEFTPPGLTDVEYLALPNGLDVILKPRTHARNVAIRLAINVGHRHFSCDKRETAHFLEHLLFKGTSKHSEAELDRLIEDNGGSWNAMTGPTRTVYQIDIHGKYLPLAIDTLYEIISDSVITTEKTALARDVIHRELGGRPSSLRRLLYRHGIGKSAGEKAGEMLLPGTGVVCPSLETLDAITQADIVMAYKNYYVANNMGLVVVGDFDPAAALRQIRQSFGRMPATSGARHALDTPPYPDGAGLITGTLAPFLGSEANVGIAYRTDGERSPHLYALWVLYAYLDRRLYERIRIEQGLAYTPAANFSWDEDYGIFMVSADSGLNTRARVERLLHEQLDALRESGLSARELEQAKRRILLGRLQIYETNADFAEYYAHNLHELSTHGRFLNREDAVARLTPEDIRRTVERYFRLDREMRFYSTPTLTYTEFYVALGALLVMLMALLAYAYRRLRRRRAQRG